MRVLVVMGVSGSGKSTIAERLAARLGWPFQEGDDLHPAFNREKMKAGIPLDDADRAPWLALIAGWIEARLVTGDHGVITCSALKRQYRATIVGNRPGVKLLYLHATRAVLLDHMKSRQHAFMPASLLDSQLATLEEPEAGENAITIDVRDAADDTVAVALQALQGLMAMR